jgi:hypothetical protein
MEHDQAMKFASEQTKICKRQTYGEIVYRHAEIEEFPSDSYQATRYAWACLTCAKFPLTEDSDEEGISDCKAIASEFFQEWVCPNCDGMADAGPDRSRISLYQAMLGVAPSQRRLVLGAKREVASCLLVSMGQQIERRLAGILRGSQTRGKLLKDELLLLVREAGPKLPLDAKELRGLLRSSKSDVLKWVEEHWKDWNLEDCLVEVAVEQGRLMFLPTNPCKS